MTIWCIFISNSKKSRGRCKKVLE